MFEHLTPLATDPILTLMQAFRDDTRPEKVDLGVGIWREADGSTPVFQAVKDAEKALWESQESKAYVGLTGDAGFHRAVADLLFGEVPERLAACATVGGTSAVRQLLALVASTRPEARIWIPAQSWPNHAALSRSLGLASSSYRWLDTRTGRLASDAILQDLRKVQPGDVVVLHACCHNPTGADPGRELQKDILDILASRGGVPLIDAAYLGFRDGPEADTALIRAARKTLPEVMLAFSGSKSFGLYRERVGLSLVLSNNPEAVQSHLAVLNRMNFTFPPDHGARVVTKILGNSRWRSLWEAELDHIRVRLQHARNLLADELRAQTQSDQFEVLRQQHGMFALFPLDETRVERLRLEHAIYAVGDGRINFAGITEQTVSRVARSVALVLR